MKHYAVSCQNFCFVESNAVCSQSIMGQEAAVVSNDMENCSENLYMSQINNCDKLYKFEPVWLCLYYWIGQAAQKGYNCQDMVLQLAVVSVPTFKMPDLLVQNTYHKQYIRVPCVHVHQQNTKRTCSIKIPLCRNCGMHTDLHKYQRRNQRRQAKENTIPPLILF